MRALVIVCFLLGCEIDNSPPPMVEVEVKVEETTSELTTTTITNPSMLAGVEPRSQVSPASWFRATSGFRFGLPNFWNVVIGDMRLVGPRPETWEMLPHYDARTLQKFDVKPGVTGYAQVLGRGDLTFTETVELDLRYVRDASLKTDLWCIKETIIAVFLQRGAY